MIDEIPLSRPDITKRDIDAVLAALRQPRLSIGPAQERFEALVARRAGRRFGVAVSSGTAGLHLSLLAVGAKAGDEVITTPFSFIASANCILYTGATPVFVDIDPVSLNMDPDKLEAAITPRTRAVIAVEVFGNSSHMDRYRAICARHEIPLIEDCCEALGGTHRGKPVGSFGRAGVFAFYPNKQITTGEGGMIVTDDDALAALCRSFRNHGRPAPGATSTTESSSNGDAAAGPMVHERLGFNYRMAEINAALGAAQMSRLDEILDARQRVAQAYIARLADNVRLVLPTVEPDTAMSWFVFVVRLDETFARDDRDRIIAGLRRHDVGSAPYFPCIHLQPFYRQRFGFAPGDFPVAESVANRSIALPFHNNLPQREIDLVAQTLEVMIDRETFRRV